MKKIQLRIVVPVAIVIAFVAVVLFDPQISQTFDEEFHLVAGC